MSEAEELSRIRERAREARAALAEPMPSDPDLKPKFEAILAASREAERAAGAEVRIGIAGVVNAGKSLLLNTLLGRADLLPVKDGPQTGNVTILRVVLRDGLASTEIEDCKIEFFDGDDARACLTWFLDKAKQKANDAGLAAPLRSELAAINPNSPTAWDATLSWSAKAWENPNPALRCLIRELTRFIRAYRSIGVALCGGPPLRITYSKATEWLGLPKSDADIQAMKFTDLPAGPRPIASRPDDGGFNAELLRDAYPLIRRVEIRVAISREIWDLSDLKGANELVLCDTPGLGAMETVVRDGYLIDRELDPTKVQTVLILLDGRSTQDARTSELFNIMQRGRTIDQLKDVAIVGLGRFDEVLGSAVMSKGLETLEKQIAKAKDDIFPEMLTEFQIFEALSKWRELNQDARSFVPTAEAASRVVPLSPSLAAVTAANDPRLIGVDVGSPACIGERRRESRAFLDVIGRWSALHETIRNDAPRGVADVGLGAFLLDGGVSRLRSLIKEHVRKHGMAQVLASAKMADRTLTSALEDLPAAVVRDVAGPETQALRGELYRLFELYRDFREKKLERGLVLNVPGPDGVSDVPLRDVLIDEVFFKINNWPRISQLLNRMRKSRIAAGGEDGGVLESTRKRGGIVAKTDDFVDPFSRTVLELGRVARKRIREGLQKLLRDFELSEEFETCRDALTQAFPDPDAVEQRLVGHYTESEEECDALFRNLQRALSPRSIGELVLMRCKLDEANDMDAERVDVLSYPLPRADGRHTLGTHLPWSDDPALAKVDFGNANHLVVVASLLDQLCTSAARVVVEDVDDCSRKLHSVLLKTTTTFLDQFKNIADDPQMPRLIVEAGKGGGEADPAAAAVARLRALLMDRNPAQDVILGAN